MRIEEKPAVQYSVKKLFLEGALKGMEIADKSPVEFEVGSVYGLQTVGGRAKMSVTTKKSFHHLKPGDVAKHYGATLHVLEAWTEPYDGASRTLVRWEEKVPEGEKPITCRGPWVSGLSVRYDTILEVEESDGQN